ncbi:hypothetical protein BDF22DRAFT_653041 [Syncephalis plumigaleata]|nr:hypothetical protein BDF22DRAFT_653041 [Syncephalis plumigaleata]
MIMVGNKNATIAAGCKSLVEVREAVTEFGRRLHAEYGYPRPVGFLYVTQEYSSHPVDDKSLDSLFTGMVLNQDKNAMDRLLQVSEPTVAVMEQCIIFAYYTYVFYKNRNTVKALKKLTIVGALCFLTSIFRVISNIVYEEQSPVSSPYCGFLVRCHRTLTTRLGQCSSDL